MEQKQMKKIGIIGAMELEVETLKSKMNVVKTTKKANMEFFEGTYTEKSPSATFFVASARSCIGFS